MKYKVGDRVYSKTFNESGVVIHISISGGDRCYWIKPDCNKSIHWIAFSNQIKPVITIKAQLGNAD